MVTPFEGIYKANINLISKAPHSAFSIPILHLNKPPASYNRSTSLAQSISGSMDSLMVFPRDSIAKTFLAFTTDIAEMSYLSQAAFVKALSRPIKMDGVLVTLSHKMIDTSSPKKLL